MSSSDVVAYFKTLYTTTALQVERCSIAELSDCRDLLQCLGNWHADNVGTISELLFYINSRAESAEHNVAEFGVPGSCVESNGVSDEQLPDEQHTPVDLPLELLEDWWITTHGQQAKEIQVNDTERASSADLEQDIQPTEDTEETSWESQQSWTEDSAAIDPASLHTSQDSPDEDIRESTPVCTIVFTPPLPSDASDEDYEPPKESDVSPFYSWTVEWRSKKVSKAIKLMLELLGADSLENVLSVWYASSQKRKALINKMDTDSELAGFIKKMATLEKQDLKKRRQELLDEIIAMRDRTLQSDDAYKLMRLMLLRFSGHFPCLSSIKLRRQEWNDIVKKRMGLQSINQHRAEVQLEHVITLIAELDAKYASDKPAATLYTLKVAFDGRMLGRHHSVLVGVIPLDSTMRIQSPYLVFPLVIFEGSEDHKSLKSACRTLKIAMQKVQDNGILINDQRVIIKFKLGLDLKSFWAATINRE